LTSGRIEELKKRRQREFKRKKNQIKYAVFCIIVAIIIYAFFLIHNVNYSILWLIGLLLGFVLQRSRFCFTASFRDPIMVGSTSLFKAVVVAFMISTVGFAIVQYNFIQGVQNISLNDIPGQIHPVGIHTALGAILFGIGMVVSGGCASGTLMRIGEGFLLQIVVLIGFIVGVLMGARHFEFWDKFIISQASTVYIPNYTGLPMATIIQVVVLILLYLLADWYDKKNSMMSM